MAHPAEGPGDSLQALVVFRRQWTASTHDLFDEVERLTPRLDVGGEHRRERREGESQNLVANAAAAGAGPVHQQTASYVGCIPRCSTGALFRKA